MLMSTDQAYFVRPASPMSDDGSPRAPVRSPKTLPCRLRSDFTRASGRIDARLAWTSSNDSAAMAALKIQSVYKGHRVRGSLQSGMTKIRARRKLMKLTGNAAQLKAKRIEAFAACGDPKLLDLRCARPSEQWHCLWRTAGSPMPSFAAPLTRRSFSPSGGSGIRAWRRFAKC